MPRTRATASAVTIPTSTETVLVTTPGIAVSAGFPIDLVGCADIITGTSTTNISLKIRRDSLTGVTVVTLGPDNVTAGNSAAFVITWVDLFPTDQANQVYVLTVTQTGASANGTGRICSLRADWG